MIVRQIENVALAVLPLAPVAWLAFQLDDRQHEVVRPLLASLALAVLAFLGTRWLVPRFKHFLSRRGLVGKDLCKVGMPGAEEPIAEATGVIPGTVFLVCIIVLQLFYGNSVEKMIDYHSGLLSICFMTFLGFTDDVLDLPWRYKLLLPTIATLPLLCAYDGSTSIVIPAGASRLLVRAGGSGVGMPGDAAATPLGAALGALFRITAPHAGHAVLVDLGLAYMAYLGMLAVFCTNAVNIYAGINGLEAGQSFVIGAAILCHNMLEMAGGRFVANHLFSAMLLLPFVGATLGLLAHNWHPASVFVGDTYCYFAGMTFAVAAIHGHFTKTLLVLFLPQVANFLLSVPQLFKIVPCPRHRLPRLHSATGLLEPSSFPNSGLLARIFASPQRPGEMINLTLINLSLLVLGPMRERTLCVFLLALQAVACGFGFWLRYHLAGRVYDREYLFE